MCAPFISTDRVVYRNRCFTRDGAAQCTMSLEKLMCKCSSGWTGHYCESREDPQAAAKSRRQRLQT
ncbi:hypothetical protein PRIPAC_97569 [Pristionchus pacificus]|uniref:Uncharacterized protein n=1 Tax=Pristionchus pacificus TaxID=54126 RepID=A0A2A6D236_PRIPA|nr:hypothetical protein PRIPAC_97569 [Pristionchus pacificus]|eukprot:PDM84406.1 hypothetical protein PRIPAC_33429 [Pristionchus pacificus]